MNKMLPDVESHEVSIHQDFIFFKILWESEETVLDKWLFLAYVVQICIHGGTVFNRDGQP